MQNKIQQIVRKTYSYWWVDGIVEMTWGFFFLILAGYNYMMVSLPASRTVSLVLAILEPLFMLAMVLADNRLVKWLKEHITYRRTGYVAYQPQSGKKRVQRGIISVVVAVCTSLIVSYVGPQLLKIDSLTMVGILLSLVTLFLAVWYGLPRLYVIATLEFALGIFITKVLVSAELHYVLLMTGIGSLWLLSGAIVFISYLLRTKPMVEDE